MLDRKKEIGKRLLEIRERKGMTQAQVAEGCDLSVDTAVLSRYESGEREMKATRLFEIAHTLGVSADAFCPEEFRNTSLSDEESLLMCFRSMKTTDQQAILTLAKSLSKILP